MTIRSRVLLFMGVVLGISAAVGTAVFWNASQARSLSFQWATMDSQRDLHARMERQAWSFLERLLVARRAGQDTQALLTEHERLIQEEFEKRREEMEALGALRQLEALSQARREWARYAHERVGPAGPEPTLETWGALLALYEREVNPRMARVLAIEEGQRRTLLTLMERSLQRSRLIGAIIPLIAAALLGLLMALILVPLHRGLRELRAGAERIGQGDLTVELPRARKDELGALAHSFNRMARELKDTLQEKERLVKAEVEAAERELRRDAEMAASDTRRYNALLEQMVRTRTAELENSNSQLAASLRKLQTMQAQLMFADRLAAMGQLAASVGHEINNPLAYVISNINYLHTELKRAQGAPSEEDRQELIAAADEAREGSERVRLIVQDLKTLSRPEDASNGTADLLAVVRSAVRMASHEIRRRARLVEDCAELPLVRGNAARLGQVFLNLLINAAHAIPEGQVEHNEIRVVARQESPERVTVEVRDTGKGIAPEHLERIFDPFFTTKPVGQGTGLGLALCHDIITTLGGAITVESQVARGTAFRVSLPVARAEGQAQEE